MTAPSTIEQVKKLEVRQASELASYLHLPPTLVNTYAVQFGDSVYFKQPLLLQAGHRKGIQTIQVDRPTNQNGEWSTECRIFPRITPEMIRALAQLPEAERKDAWAYTTAPTREWGHASTSNVKMSTMHQWLPEIAIKRAVSRALRLFAGIGGTSYEELPEVELGKTDVEEARHHVISDERPKPSAQPTKQSPTMSLMDNTPSRSSQE